MERVAEFYAFLTLVVIGFSHLLHPRPWVETFAALHRLGKPGAFVNGGLSLVPGAVFVAVHPGWSGPGMVLTHFGWLLVIKGSICFLAPEAALRSMGRAGSGKGQGFRAAGVLALVMAGVLGYSLWMR